MSYQERIEESVQAFKNAVAEPNLDTVIEAIINKAYEKMSGVYLFSETSLRGSQFQAVPTSSGPVYYLNISQSAPNKREIIYELLHEMGHAFDEILLDLSDKENSERGRETRAWQFADEQFVTYPELRPYLPEYTEHKRKRLATYGL
jgi:Zn-dependent peptidase ImmA (M78 family)